MKLLIGNITISMEKVTLSRGNSLNEFTEKSISTLVVPKSSVKIMAKYGLLVAIRIVINRLRFRVMCRVLYSLDLLRICQIHYNQLKASKVTRYLILKSITSYRFSTLIWRIENYYRPEKYVKGVSPRSSKMFEEMLKKQN